MFGEDNEAALLLSGVPFQDKGTTSPVPFQDTKHSYKSIPYFSE
jgi:hypothetical protein